jgi:hypothetical protein
METERIALSQQERERLRVLHEVQQRHLTQVEAAKRLKVTDRQVRRLLLAFEERLSSSGSSARPVRTLPASEVFTGFTSATAHVSRLPTQTKCRQLYPAWLRLVSTDGDLAVRAK